MFVLVLDVQVINFSVMAGRFPATWVFCLFDLILYVPVNNLSVKSLSKD